MTEEIEDDAPVYLSEETMRIQKEILERLLVAKGSRVVLDRLHAMVILEHARMLINEAHDLISVGCNHLAPKSQERYEFADAERLASQTELKIIDSLYRIGRQARLH